MWGELKEPQRIVVRSHVTGRHVADLGSGNLILANELISLGAKRVWAVDKLQLPRHHMPRLELVPGYFENYHDPIDVAFVSWPINWFDQGLLDCITRAKTVLYLGKNTDGCACGFPAIFKHMCDRELLHYVPDRKNTLIVCGDLLSEPRVPTAEEYAGIFSATEAILSYEELEKTHADEVG